MKKIAIVQSNYIPWRGYFKLIDYVDEFVFYDEVQYTRRDWRNRNKIIINNKPDWLTIPLKNKGNYKESISRMVINDNKWIQNHLQIISDNYFKAKYFDEVFSKLSKIFLNSNSEFLSIINKNIITHICELLKIKTKFYNSYEFFENESKSFCANERLIEICEKINCQIYVSGPSAKNYLVEEKFYKKNIKVEWFDYKNTKVYNQNNQNNQNNQKFFENLSIVDCMLHCGFDKKKFL